MLNRSGAEPSLRACFSGSLTDLTDRPEGWLRSGLRLLLVCMVSYICVCLFFYVAGLFQFAPTASHFAYLRASYYLNTVILVFSILASIFLVAGTSAFRVLACVWSASLLLILILRNIWKPKLGGSLWLDLSFLALFIFAMFMSFILFSRLARDQVTVQRARIAMLGRLALFLLNIFRRSDHFHVPGFLSEQVFHLPLVRLLLVLFWLAVSLLEIRVVFEVLRSHVQPITPPEQRLVVDAAQVDF